MCALGFIRILALVVTSVCRWTCCLVVLPLCTLVTMFRWLVWSGVGYVRFGILLGHPCSVLRKSGRKCRLFLMSC